MALMLFFLVGTVFGAFFALQTNPVFASIHADASYEISFQTLDGEPIHDYDWGYFQKNESKELDCQLLNLGNKPAKIMWKTIELSPGWDVEFWDQTRPKSRLWESSKIITLAPGKILELNIVLTEKSVDPNQKACFRFIFTSSGVN